jgi:biotin-(acetyl-CoA carboxylase) ligase
MSEDKNTKTNVVGIGHNNTYSKEQYEKLVQSLHQMYKFARQEVRRVQEMYESAFTGYWKGHGDKLKPHEKYDERQNAINLESKFSKHCNEHIAAIEAKAKAQGIEIPDRETDPEEDKSDS